MAKPLWLYDGIDFCQGSTHAIRTACVHLPNSVENGKGDDTATRWHPPEYRYLPYTSHMYHIYLDVSLNLNACFHIVQIADLTPSD